MSCDLTLGRTEPCKDKIGGIKEVYFINFGDMPLADITYDLTDTDVIDSVGTSIPAFKYEVRGASSFTQNIQSNPENGTTVFNQVVSLTLKGLTKEDHKELKLLSFGRPHIVVRDYNDNYFLAGLENGCEVTEGTIVTGQAMGDLSGYTLTLTGNEPVPANFIIPSTPSAGVMVDAGFTVT